MNNDRQQEQVIDENILCSYGCGQQAKYKLKNGKYCCCNNTAKCPAIRQKLVDNHADGKQVYKNLSQESKNKMNWNKNKTFIPLEEVFKQDSKYNTTFLKRYLNIYNLKEYKCELCGNDGNWNGNTLILELHHKDGDRHNNNLDNLQYLCPNCHSQTDTFRKRNKKQKHYKSNWGINPID